MDSKHLAAQIRRAVGGEAWHGPSWAEALGGVTAEQAAAVPIQNAHSIADIVRHATTWNDVVFQRLQGETPDVTEAEDWPPSAELGARAWKDATRQFFAGAERLASVVAEFPEGRLRDQRPLPASGTWADLILGQLQHLTYHAGQVALLRKA